MAQPSPRTARAGPRSSLPHWATVLVVVAHPDDESFGLGAVIDQMSRGGAAVHILCYTHGEASTLNETGADLRSAREAELRLASAELGAATVTLLDYTDGQLDGVAVAELAGPVRELAARHRPAGLLVFDDTGITGHPDHRAATWAALSAAGAAALPVLAWTLPAAVADRLRSETGQPFAGQRPDRIDFLVPVSRAAQRRAAEMHATQVSPRSVLWRRLELLGEHEHLRWLPGPQPGQR